MYFFFYAKYFRLEICAPILAKLDGKLNMKGCTEYVIPQSTHLIKSVK